MINVNIVAANDLKKKERRRVNGTPFNQSQKVSAETIKISQELIGRNIERYIPGFVVGSENKIFEDSSS